MKISILSFLFAAALTLTQSFNTQAQSAISSTEDYNQIRSSINILSQKLYAYAQQYPDYGFLPEYNEHGKLTAMKVTGVTEEKASKQISSYLLELERLGEIVRNMNPAYLPKASEDFSKVNLSEKQARNYTPSFADTHAPSSEEMMTSKKAK